MLGLSRDELLEVLREYTIQVAHKPPGYYRISGLDELTENLAISDQLMIGLMMDLIEANNRKITEQLAAKGIRLDD